MTLSGDQLTSLVIDKHNALAAKHLKLGKRVKELERVNEKLKDMVALQEVQMQVFRSAFREIRADIRSLKNGEENDGDAEAKGVLVR